MKFLTLLGVLFTFECALAQGHLTGRAAIDSVKAEQYATPLIFVTFDPATSFFNLIHPRWRIGYTHFIKPDFGVGLDFGYGDKESIFGYLNHNQGLDYQLWELKVRAFKLYNLTGQPTYLGVAAAFVNQTDLLEDNLYVKEGRRIDFERAKYVRRKYALNLRYGHLFEIWRNMWIDGYVGLGFKYREVRFEDVVLRNPFRSSLGTLQITSQVREGAYWGLNFSLGINVLFRLK